MDKEPTLFDFNGAHGKPFLKWAGGKGQLIGEIMDRVKPCIEDIDTYIEPFIGSGAVMFHILSNYPWVKVVMNDLNGDLINAYKVVRDDVDSLIADLYGLQSGYYGAEDKDAYYYGKRDEYNRRDFSYREISVRNASLFIFLNKTCFNGMYRVNAKNGFNIPASHAEHPTICDEENLRNVNGLLQRVTILNGDYAETIEYSTGESTLFYFDPPYKPISATSSFNSYFKNNFDDGEQIRLKEFCDNVNGTGAKFLMSNSDPKSKDESNDFFDVLYSDYVIDRVEASRSINANGKGRGKVKELLIKNF